VEKSLKPIHYLFYLLVAPVSLFCLINWGWSFYSTITDRPGLWGDMYMYYHLSKVVYSFYCFLLAAVATVFLLAPIVLMIKRNEELLSRFYIYFLWFASFVILSQIGLSFLFEGKG
jgi:hypothetical protein